MASASLCVRHSAPSEVVHAPDLSIPHLSFATDLLFNIDEVREHCAQGLTTQNNLITLLKSRIALERSYAAELRKMAENSRLEELEHGTMREALGKLKAQYLNTSVQHRLLAMNFEEDVLKPIETLYAVNHQKAQNLVKLVGNIKKQAKVQEDAYKKDYTAFDKGFREAVSAFSQAMDSGFSSTLIELQYQRDMAEMAWSADDDRVGCSTSPTSAGNGYPRVASPSNGMRQRHGSCGSIPPASSNNSQKLVNWLLSTEQQRKEGIFVNAVHTLEAAELARRKCQQAWELVEQSRVDMFCTLQSVLTEYQQMTEHRSANLATNLRKHVVFESSALANEQYDWQMIATQIENVDFEGDIRDFIRSTHHQAHDLAALTVHDLCDIAVASTLVTSPTSRQCRALRKTPLEISDIALRKMPIDCLGNQEMLPSVLVTRALPDPTRTLASKEDTPSSGPGSPLPASPTATSSDAKTNANWRVSLAQDVARAIARAYEWRAMQRNLQTPVYQVDRAEPEDAWGGDQRGESSHYNSRSTTQSNDADEEDPGVTLSLPTADAIKAARTFKTTSAQRLDERSKSMHDLTRSSVKEGAV